MDRIYFDKLEDNYLAFALQGIEKLSPSTEQISTHNIKSLHDIIYLKDYKGKKLLKL